MSIDPAVICLPPLALYVAYHAYHDLPKVAKAVKDCVGRCFRRFQSQEHLRFENYSDTQKLLCTEILHREKELKSEKENLAPLAAKVKKMEEELQRLKKLIDDRSERKRSDDPLVQDLITKVRAIAAPSVTGVRKRLAMKGPAGADPALSVLDDRLKEAAEMLIEEVRNKKFKGGRGGIPEYHWISKKPDSLAKCKAELLNALQTVSVNYGLSNKEVTEIILNMPPNDCIGSADLQSILGM